MSFYMFTDYLDLLCEVPAQISFPIFYWVVFFLLISKSSLYFLDMSPLLFDYIC